jgi:hypothetical protein
MARQAQDRAAFKQDVAAFRYIESRKTIEERGLAGPIGADDADDLAGRNIETDTVEGNDAAESHRNVPHTQQGFAADMDAGVQLGLHKHTGESLRFATGVLPRSQCADYELTVILLAPIRKGSCVAVRCR